MDHNLQLDCLWLPEKLNYAIAIINSLNLEFVNKSTISVIMQTKISKYKNSNLKYK